MGYPLTFGIRKGGKIFQPRVLSPRILPGASPPPRIPMETRGRRETKNLDRRYDQRSVAADRSGLWPRKQAGIRRSGCGNKALQTYATTSRKLHAGCA